MRSLRLARVSAMRDTSQCVPMTAPVEQQRMAALHAVALSGKPQCAADVFDRRPRRITRGGSRDGKPSEILQGRALTSRLSWMRRNVRFSG